MSFNNEVSINARALKAQASENNRRYSSSPIRIQLRLWNSIGQNFHIVANVSGKALLMNVVETS